MTLAPGTLEILRATPDVVRALLASLPQEVVDAPDPGGWSARDLVAHLVDRGRIQRARVERLLAQPDAHIEDADEQEGLEASGLRSLPLADLLAMLEREHPADAERYSALEAADLAASGRHTAAGDITVAHLVHQAAYHDTIHIAQIATAVGASPAKGRGPFAMFG